MLTGFQAAHLLLSSKGYAYPSPRPFPLPIHRKPAAVVAAEESAAVAAEGAQNGASSGLVTRTAALGARAALSVADFGLRRVVLSFLRSFIVDGRRRGWNSMSVDSPRGVQRSLEERRGARWCPDEP